MTPHSITIDNKVITPREWDANSIDTIKVEDHIYHCINDNTSYTVVIDQIDFRSKQVVLRVNGQSYQCSIKDKLDHTLSKLNLNTSPKTLNKNIVSTMPGLVLSILVKKGQVVSEGDPLMILEAMKMENVLKAIADGTVIEICCSEKEAVDKRQILIEIS